MESNAITIFHCKGTNTTMGYNISHTFVTQNSHFSVITYVDISLLNEINYFLYFLPRFSSTQWIATPHSIRQEILRFDFADDHWKITALLLITMVEPWCGWWMSIEQSSPPVLRKSREGTVWGVVLIGVSVWEQEFPTPLVFYNCWPVVANCFSMLVVYVLCVSAWTCECALTGGCWTDAKGV